MEEPTLLAIVLQEKGNKNNGKENPEHHQSIIQNLPHAMLGLWGAGEGGTEDGGGEVELKSCQAAKKVSSRSQFSFAAIHVERITITFLCR